MNRSLASDFFGFNMKKKVLVNAANLHVGGGVQVAVSFLSELSSISSDTIEFHVVSSSEVDFGLKKTVRDTSVFSSYRIIDVYGLESCLPKFSKMLSKYDGIFTVFGPDYSIGHGKKRIVGFAQPWIIYPNNEIFWSMNFHSRLRTRLKYFLQNVFFRSASRLIVELPHVKTRLVEIGVMSEEFIDVVHNSVSAIYLSPELWEPINFEPKSESNIFNLGFVGRDYPHKNLDILPEIKVELKRRYNIDVDFFVTLNSNEWSRKSEKFRNLVSTVGELSVAQCPSFYQSMDAIIFPSLLECFSATPLEAMVMKRPLFASDRSFVKDVCKDYSYYFDPLDPVSAADLIANYLSEIRGHDREKIEEARNYAIRFSSAKGRAEQYVRIIESEFSRT